MNRQTKFVARSRAAILSAVVLVIAAARGPAFPFSAFAQGPSAQAGRQQSTAIRAGITQLHEAARSGNMTLLKSQLQQGTNPNVPDSQGRTALMDAVQAGQTKAVSVLLDAGADVNARSRSGRTALIEAAEEGRFDSARLLVEHGADLNLATRTGTALETAERTGHNDIAALLLKAGARSSGHSVGDTVCVRPWAGDGYCGVVEAIDKNTYQLRVTEIVGCKNGCPAKAECSAQRPVGGPDGISVGSEVETKSWCLTHTAVQR